MRMINGEQPTWKLGEVYGIIYGYNILIGGLCITFFTNHKTLESDSTSDDGVYIHYTAFSVTGKMLKFDITMTVDKTIRVNASTTLKSQLEVSHSGDAMPITPAYYPKVERIAGMCYHVARTPRVGVFQITVCDQ